jgi:DNA repair protein RadC
MPDNREKSISEPARRDNLHAGHRNRLRTRFLHQGLSGFEQHNMLELLLFYAIPRRDVNELAHELLHRYGSLSGVLDADPDELMRSSGLTENTVALLKLIPALAREYLLDRGSRVSALDSFDKLGAYFCDYFTGLKRESSVVLPIAANGMPCKPVVIAEGSPDSCELDMRKLAECVIRAEATSFVLAHNHPGGDADPSDADLVTTRVVRDTFARLGIPLREHFIIAGRNFTRCLSYLSDY